MSLRILALTVLACAATSASAGTLLTEDFSGASSGTYGVGTIAGTQFAVTTANVDVGGVLNGGGFFACSGNPAGNCVDLVGSNSGGGIASVPTFTLTAGDTYTVTFGGTLQSGSTNPALTTFSVGLGSLSQVETVTTPYAPATFTLTFKPTVTQTNAALLFTTLVPADSVHGEVIDHIALSETAGSAGAVPEPAAWALMLGGFGLVGTAARRRRQATVAA